MTLLSITHADKNKAANKFINLNINGIGYQTSLPWSLMTT